MGLGCVCVSGITLAEVMQELYTGRRYPSFSSVLSADIDKTSPLFEVDSKSLVIKQEKGTGIETSKTTDLAVKAFDEASKQARLSEGPVDPSRVGVIIGTTVGCTLNDEEFYRDYLDKKKPGLASIERYLSNNPAQFLSRQFGCHGPAVTIANACSSGTDAIGVGKAWVESGLCDIVIAGGTDELCRTTYLGFTSLLITSTEPCRPFDKNREGLNLGEGAGIVIIESERSAKKRGLNPLAFIKGYGSSADAYHPTAPHPEGLGLKRALAIAFKDAELAPEEIAFINAHGTATHDNDKVEGRVIADIFGTRTPVVSTKGYTGHTLGAAGGIEFVFTVAGLLEGKIPKTVGFDESDTDCFIMPTTENTTINGKHAISTSLAFGGTNSALIVGV